MNRTRVLFAMNAVMSYWREPALSLEKVSSVVQLPPPFEETSTRISSLSSRFCDVR
jgi:hypothetical protein